MEQDHCIAPRRTDSAYPMFRTPASICFSALNVFVLADRGPGLPRVAPRPPGRPFLPTFVGVLTRGGRPRRLPYG
jgi:hypothetical protein